MLYPITPNYPSTYTGKPLLVLLTRGHTSSYYKVILLTDLRQSLFLQYFTSRYYLTLAMNGIPIHTQSPITAAAKASGITPKTDAPPTQPSQHVPNSYTATTTAPAAGSS